MTRVFTYLTTGYFTLATALNAFAADPLKVKRIADYVMDKGRAETMSLGNFNGQGKTFEWPVTLRDQNGRLVDSFGVIAQAIIANDIKVLFITQRRYNRTNGRLWYIIMGDSARGQEWDGTLNFAEAGTMSSDSNSNKENKVEYHRISPADKVEWDYADSTFDSLVEIINAIIPK